MPTGNQNMSKCMSCADIRVLRWHIENEIAILMRTERTVIRHSIINITLMLLLFATGILYHIL